MIKKYFEVDKLNVITGYISCSDEELALYKDLNIDKTYVETKLDDFIFERDYIYTVEGASIVKNKSFNEALSIEVRKRTAISLIADLEVVYNNVVYQCDEVSQSRISRAIIGLPFDDSVIMWKAKDNSIHHLSRLDLENILYLAIKEHTRIWIQ